MRGRALSLYLTDPTTTIADIQRAVIPSMSGSTIGRRLHDAGLHAHRPLPRLSLTPRHRHQRLQWCRTRLSWSDSEWQRVIFSDESRFSLGGDAQRIRVWRHRGQRQVSHVQKAWCHRTSTPTAPSAGTVQPSSPSSAVDEKTGLLLTGAVSSIAKYPGSVWDPTTGIKFGFAGLVVRFLGVPPGRGSCPLTGPLPFDLIYTDYHGLQQMKQHMGLSLKKHNQNQEFIKENWAPGNHLEHLVGPANTAPNTFISEKEENVKLHSCFKPENIRRCICLSFHCEKTPPFDGGACAVALVLGLDQMFTAKAVLQQWTQDADHRMLTTGRCPQDAALRTLPIGRSPQDAALRMLPTGRCP
ncbi:hypothetical protein NFI96_004321 [Prochilodus magdalenae]|nr:hypothetical protein NFI96_004321 [Prochilodus magdalenae]